MVHVFDIKTLHTTAPLLYPQSGCPSGCSLSSLRLFTLFDLHIGNQWCDLPPRQLPPVSITAAWSETSPQEPTGASNVHLYLSSLINSSCLRFLSSPAQLTVLLTPPLLPLSLHHASSLFISAACQEAYVKLLEQGACSTGCASQPSEPEIKRRKVRKASLQSVTHTH